MGVYFNGGSYTYDFTNSDLANQVALQSSWSMQEQMIRLLMQSYGTLGQAPVPTCKSCGGSHSGNLDWRGRCDQTLKTIWKKRQILFKHRGIKSE